MDWVEVFNGFGVPVAMLVYFIWHSQKRDGDFKVMREAHTAAEKEALEKYTELTKHVTGVITTVQAEINSLTNRVGELAELIRRQTEGR